MTKQGLSDGKVRLPLKSRRGVERPSQEGLLEEVIGMYWEGVRENYLGKNVLCKVSEAETSNAYVEDMIRKLLEIEHNPC